MLKVENLWKTGLHKSIFGELETQVLGKKKYAGKKKKRYVIQHGKTHGKHRGNIATREKSVFLTTLLYIYFKPLKPHFLQKVSETLN